MRIRLKGGLVRRVVGKGRIGSGDVGGGYGGCIGGGDYREVAREGDCGGEVWPGVDGGKDDVGEGVNVVIEIMEELMVVIRFCLGSKRTEKEEEGEERRRRRHKRNDRIKKRERRWREAREGRRGQEGMTCSDLTYTLLSSTCA